MIGGAVVVTALRVVGMVAQLALVAVLAMLLGEEGFDQVAFALFLAGFLTVPGRFGCDRLLQRLLPTEPESGRRALVRWALVRVMAVSALVAGATVAVIHFGGLGGAHLDGSAWVVVVGLVVTTGLVEVLQSALQAIRRQVAAVTVAFLLRPLMAIVAVSVWWWWADALSAFAALVALVATTAVAVAILAVPLWRLPRGAPSRRTGLDREAFALSQVTVVNALTLQADGVLLGLLGPGEEVGEYLLVNRLVNVLGLSLYGVNAMLTPELSTAKATGDLSRLAPRYRRLVAAFAAMTLLGAIVIVAVGPWLIGLLGAGGVAVLLPLLVLAAARVVSVACGPVGFTLLMFGEPRIVLVTGAVAGVANCLLAVLLIPALGATGAAIAAAVSMTGWYLFLAVVVARRHGLGLLARR